MEEMLEKVVKGTEICLSGGSPDRCAACPYKQTGCDRQRMKDSLALIKYQADKIKELENLIAVYRQLHRKT